MLLHRLTEHAERARDALPPPYYRWRSVRWAIVLRPDGTLAVPGLSDQGDNEHPAGTLLEVPYIVRAGVLPPPMLLADDLRTAWRDSAPDDPVASAVVSFFEHKVHAGVTVPPAAKATDVAAFMVDGSWAHEQQSAVTFWGCVARDRKSSAGGGICLVCGTEGPMLETIPEMVKSGAIPAGSGRGRDAALVSVNKPAQGRGGKIQLASSPVCDKCGSAAMSALNALLADGSSRYRTADSVMTWWLRDGRKIPVADWLNDPKPEQVGALIRGLSEPSRLGRPGKIAPDAFCAVTLSVNQSRVVVRDWLEVPLRILVRLAGRPTMEGYMTGLDPDLPSPPYQCGRMLAVLEDIQRAALGREINTTIADKYLPAATTTPLAILTMLRKNANGHLKRIRRTNTPAYYSLSGRLDEVMAHLSADPGIPATLPLAGQAEFILGYHHQRAADIATARERGGKHTTTPDHGEDQ